MTETGNDPDQRPFLCLPDGRLPQELPDWAVECVSRFFAALGDPTKLRILHLLLVRGELHVGALAAELGLSISAVSHQLRLLKDRRLVTGERRGRAVAYSVADDHVRQILEVGLLHACGTCPLKP